MSEQALTSTRPYLLRALYEWIVDNDLTPHLLVATSDPRVEVPRQFIENGVIVLNVSPSAVRDLDLGNEFISFNARFAGVAQNVLAPTQCVQAIYARENGQGMFLADDHEGGAAETDIASQPTAAVSEALEDDKPARPGRAPHLTVVK